MHLRGHVEAQDPLRVRYLEAGIIEDGVIHFFRRRQNVFQFTFITGKRVAQHGKPRFLPRSEVDDICFRDLRFNQHGAEIRQRQNVRRLLGGDHCLSLQGGNLRHFAGHRRQDPRVIEVGLRRIERRLVTLYLRFNSADLRLFHRQIGGRGIKVLPRDQLALRQLLLTGQSHLRQFALRARLIELGAQLHERRFHLFNLVLRLLRIDNPQQLILFNLIANIDVQRFQLSADLGADVNFSQGIQFAGGQHALLEIPFANYQRLVVRQRRIEDPPSPDSQPQHNDRQQPPDGPAFSLHFHIPIPAVSLPLQAVILSKPVGNRTPIFLVNDVLFSCRRALCRRK
ncbi:Uncharacterised protein [Klebsiella pneumoniae]|nr:Uncharacterised protein [Klebsiella pneumoniae]